MATAAIGHNEAPPIESHRMHIEDLLVEANNWLDGDPVLNQAQADEIGKLLNHLREARKGADAQRVIEKKPHDDAAKAVQAVWKPLIDRVDLAEQTAKKALAPFLAAQEAEQRRVAEVARIEAQRLADEARAAVQSASAASLADREAAEAKVALAERARKDAARLDKDKAQAKTGGRSVGLRSIFTPVLVDPAEALKHYRAVEPQALKDFLVDLANRDIRAGLRAIPGFDVKEERVAR